MIRDQTKTRLQASIATISEHLDDEDERASFEKRGRTSLESERKMSHAAALRPSLTSGEKKDFEDAANQGLLRVDQTLLVSQPRLLQTQNT